MPTIRRIDGTKTKKDLNTFRGDIYLETDNDTVTIKFALSLIFQLASVIIAVVSEIPSINGHIAPRLVMKFIALAFFLVGIISSLLDIVESREKVGKIYTDLDMLHKQVEEGKAHALKPVLDTAIALIQNIQNKPGTKINKKSDEDIHYKLRLYQLTDGTYKSIAKYPVSVNVVVAICLAFCIVAEIVGLFYESIPLFIAVGITTAAPLLAEILLDTFNKYLVNLYKYSLAASVDIQHMIYKTGIESLIDDDDTQSSTSTGTKSVTDKIKGFFKKFKPATGGDHIRVMSAADLAPAEVVERPFFEDEAFTDEEDRDLSVGLNP